MAIWTVKDSANRTSRLMYYFTDLYYADWSACGWFYNHGSTYTDLVDLYSFMTFHDSNNSWIVVGSQPNNVGWTHWAANSSTIRNANFPDLVNSSTENCWVWCAIGAANQRPYSIIFDPKRGWGYSTLPLTLSHSDWITSDPHIYLGNWASPFSDGANCSIYDVRVFNKFLGFENLKKEAFSKRPVHTGNLHAHWMLNTVDDLSDRISGRILAPTGEIRNSENPSWYTQEKKKYIIPNSSKMSFTRKGGV